MKPILAALLAGTLAWSNASFPGRASAQPTQALSPNGSQPLPRLPLGQPGRVAHYKLQMTGAPRANTVTRFTLGLGPIEKGAGPERQWLTLEATKAGGNEFRLWLFTAGYPSEKLQAAEDVIARYLLQEGASRAFEFRDRFTHKAVLPCTGGWRYLLPRSGQANSADERPVLFPKRTHYLGLDYELETVEQADPAPPPNDPRIIELTPNLVIGTASNTRQKDEKRRYDNSDYDYERLTRKDYLEMTQAGLNCLHVDAQQLPWVEGLDAFYWGVGAHELPFPECLYRSSYLGPTLFLDEPAVGTRDSVIRPRLAKEETFRKSITPELVLEAFKDYFQRTLKAGPATSLLAGLKERTDVDLGEMNFRQENLFSWETMVASAAYELTQDPVVPAAMVLEPPGRVGTLRTLPELDMSYGCQLPVDNPNTLTDILYGFLRGAARLTHKSWGTSIYGAVDRADAPVWLTHAYDLGATRFFFWDNGKLACVPFGECLALARTLRAHAENYPDRELQRLNQAAEVAILLPPGYNLGHVYLGKGNLWGLPELNLERRNAFGVTYRAVMHNFFIEIERCIQQGVGFDLLWDLPQIQATGYREVITIRADGKVEVSSNGKVSLLKGARSPGRPEGVAPRLQVTLSTSRGRAPLKVRALGTVHEGSAPVYYTFGADPQGICHNAMIAWELYGPEAQDYRSIIPEHLEPRLAPEGDHDEVSVTFTLKRPGRYRLRAATVDRAGRSAVSWNWITVSE